MSKFASSHATIGFTTMHNKLHLNTNDSMKPNCGQGNITEITTIKSHRNPASWQDTIDSAVRAALLAEPNADFCGRCFKAVAA